jgi:hypothetical protein
MGMMGVAYMAMKWFGGKATARGDAEKAEKKE